MDSLEDVAKWVTDHDGEGQGVHQLRAALAIGMISGKSARFARAWLDEHEHGDRRRLEAEQIDLDRRATAAAEASATAAKGSEKHAADSARWSKWALVLAAVALIVSAWPFIKDIGK